ncbi:hypothetical protein [Gymnodinialimonas ulvae]|uniref:hypothetical protein n=1 Tax=Gymnodinialimonas ulvae TaxID=3126504 RepID=UPI0030B2686E
MTETGRIEPVYLGYRFGIYAAALALGATGAAASTLSEFQMRCLTPMIEVRESDTSGLSLIEDMAGRETWVAEGQDWHLSRASADAVVLFCAIHGTFGTEVDAFAETALASGDWVRIDRVPETLQSVFLREPLIEVEIDREGGSLTVIETNLES